MARWTIIPERSRLSAEARSSLHPIRAETDRLTGAFEAEIGPVGADLRVPPSGQLRLEAAALRTGNVLYDREIARRVEIARYPEMRGEIRGVERLPDGRYRIRGDLSFHGVTCGIAGDVALRMLDDRTVELEGETILDMRDFGLEPPRLLMLRVHPDVRVRGRLVAEREH
jgi:polyisoprenoid-binding protein YceI